MIRARSARLVATFDLLESLRSRKAIALLLLYLAGALGGSALFIRLLHAIQDRLRDQYGEAATVEALMESPAMARMATELAGDAETAAAIVAIPPLALFYGWLATNFVPLLVLFTSSDAISGDLASGSVRYSLFRVDRASWVVGKLIGQTSLMALGVVVGALGCWLMGVIWLDDMPVGASAWWLLRIGGRSIIYGFAYLGVALCASQLTRTNARARALALLMMFCCSLGGGLLQLEPVEKLAPSVMGALQKLFPNGHSLALWHPGWFERGTAFAALIAIGLAYFALGFWRFSRRDA
ncbi:MAG: ABC transporter permease subunit [Deltaproteobacteria bacterium]|jgi:ABC-type transport system involved in multi-copper enzyme maturation permease subunit|nr:ABC transporter permease subunit [Deltaproteobacteria bacterium]MBW2530117.1 ABC transporter permease subunit [Deltaproteobacteria bacterium]